MHEEMQTSQEELKSANEELQSTNEELQSTNEELTTAKEEMQSMNEELQTVNQENRHKVEELSQLSSDLQNLLAATEIATLFLDRELRILRFTPKVGELVNVRPVDRGRPLSDLTHRLGYPELEDDARAVLHTLVPLEREVEDEAGHCYLTRVLPYRSGDDRIEGVVITLLDITPRKRSEEALQESEARFRAVANLVSDLLWQTDPQGQVVWYNERWYAFTGQTPANALGEGWMAAMHPDDVASSRKIYFDAVRAGQPYRLEHRIRAADGSYRWFLVRGEPFRLAGLDLVFDDTLKFYEAPFQMRASNDLQTEIWNEDTSGFPFTGAPKYDPRVSPGVNLAPLVRKWYSTAGKEGMEPTPELKKLVEIIDTAKTVGPEEQVKLAKELFTLWVDQMYEVSVLGEPERVDGLEGLDPRVYGVIVVSGPTSRAICRTTAHTGAIPP